MSRIKEVFADLRKDNKTGFIPYVVSHDPDLATFAQILKNLAENGADLIEVGIPFSDPVADGVTIQNATRSVLEKGFDFEELFAAIKNFRDSYATPIVLMGYYNLIYRMGEAKFLACCQNSGVDGLIVVDLPMEEEFETRKLSQNHGIDLIRLITPTCSAQRVKTLVQDASGFIYLVTVAGTTGSKKAQLNSVENMVKLIRSHSLLPIAAGFGISTPEEAAVFKGKVNAVVMGSAIVKIISQNNDSLLSNLTNFIRDISAKLHDQ